MGSMPAKLPLLPLLFCLLQLPVLGWGCPLSYPYPGQKNRQYTVCQELGVQDATIAWSYKADWGRLDVAFSGQLLNPKGWVGWGINPSGWGMAGSSALVAFVDSNSGSATVQTYQLGGSSQSGSGLQPTSVLAINLLSRAVAMNGLGVTIFASVKLSKRQAQVNIVWNRGASVVGLSPQPHALLTENLHGFTTLDLI